MQVQPLGRMVDVKSNHLALGINTDVWALGDLNGVRPGPRLKLDVEAVGLWIVVKFQGYSSLRKLLPINALRIVSSSARPATLRSDFRLLRPVEFPSLDAQVPSDSVEGSYSQVPIPVPGNSGLPVIGWVDPDYV